MFVYLTTPRSQNTFVVRVFGDLPFQQRHDSLQKKKKNRIYIPAAICRAHGNERK